MQKWNCDFKGLFPTVK